MVQAGMTAVKAQSKQPTEVHSQRKPLASRSRGIITLNALQASAPPLHQSRAGTMAQILRAQTPMTQQ